MKPHLLLMLAPLALASCNAPTASAMVAEEKAAVVPVAEPVQTAANPVVLELFQSQGCSSCPPANAALNAIAEQADGNIIALSFAVTYWDRLGWKDTFAAPEFTQRQYDYAKSLGGDGVYTPQVVINGRRAIVGNGKGELAREVAATKRLTGGPAITVQDGTVSIGAAANPSGAAQQVFLIRYDPRAQEVPIRAGENGGRTLPHRNIVRQLVPLGAWNGKAVTYSLPTNTDANLRSVILIQPVKTGAIVAAKHL